MGSTTGQISSTDERVRPTMILAVIGLWLAISYRFLWKFADAGIARYSWQERAIVLTVAGWIALTCFYASYHLVSFLFSIAVRMRHTDVPRNFESTPTVAILYPCMNDFREKSLDTCLAQDYPNYEVFVLDDSTICDERDRVDAYDKENSGRLTIIRRNIRKGYKAGNLNNGLRKIGRGYKYICVVDADELLPARFLAEMVGIAEGNQHFGFVQASHSQYAETSYGKCMGDGIDLHWSYFLPARNHFGFVYFYGHGALLQSEALTAVGGFPEVASEDVALSTKFREAGYRGYFAHKIKSFEEAPPTYQAFRRRTQKATSGTLEFLARYYPSFFRSPNVSFVEKVDLLIATSLLYLPAVFFSFLFVLHCEILLLAGGSAGLRGLIAGWSGSYASVTTKLFLPLQGWESSAFLLFTILAPLCYLVPNAFRCPRRVLLYILRAGAVHISVCFNILAVAFKWLLDRRANFVPTGDRSLDKSGSKRDFWELYLGLAMLVIGLIMGSLCLLAVGLSLALVPPLHKSDLDGRVVSVAIALPAVLTIVAVLGTPLSAVGILGMSLGLGISHA